MLLQLSSSGPLLLQTIQGEGAGVQGQEQEDQGDPAHLPGGPLLQVGLFYFTFNGLEFLDSKFLNFSIVTQKRKVGTIAPKKFIARLRKEKVEFDNYMQQVAVGFLECFF